ncbi:MAG: hypothetical protein AAFZ65_05960 [Planctomycetota bacterium]
MRIHPLIVAWGLLVSPAAAQWPLDAASDLLLSDGDGDEVQALVAPAPDGGAWVSWFDSDPQGAPAFGFDVRVQRLAPNGEPLLAPGGVLVADRGFSSTQSYGLDVGPDGSAYLTFRDDRTGGVQITATRVLPDGSQPWGPLGVQLTQTSLFVASPRVAVDGDELVVAWTQDINLALARLDSSGSEVWPNPIVVPPPADTSLALSDLVALDSGHVGVAWVLTVGGFFGTRQLWVQRLNAAGQPQWAAAGVPLELTNSLQLGNFPSIAHDGAGGLVAAWYGTGPLTAYAQRVLADGSLAFGASTVELSTDASNLHVSPSIDFDAASGESVAVWVETDASQNDRGIFAQKLSATGQRLWGAGGVALAPLGSVDVSQANALWAAGGVRAVWSSGGFGNEHLRAAATDASGTLTQGPFDLTTTAASLGDVATTTDAFGAGLVAWHDNRNGDQDLFAKSWAPSGAIGPAPGALAVDLPANETVLAGTLEPLGGTLDLVFDAFGSTYLTAVAFASLGATTLPFGNDTLYVDPTALGGELLGFPASAGSSPSWSLPLPANPALAGLRLHAQVAGVLPTLEIVLSDGLEIWLGL